MPMMTETVNRVRHNFKGRRTSERDVILPAGITRAAALRSATHTKCGLHVINVSRIVVSLASTNGWTNQVGAEWITSSGVSEIPIAIRALTRGLWPMGHGKLKHIARPKIDNSFLDLISQPPLQSAF
jgi:hypothetical protein